MANKMAAEILCAGLWEWALGLLCRYCVEMNSRSTLGFSDVVDEADDGSDKDDRKLTIEEYGLRHRSERKRSRRKAKKK